MHDIFSCPLDDLRFLVTNGLEMYVRRNRGLKLLFIKDAIAALPAEKLSRR